MLYVTDPLNGSIHLFRAKDGTQIGEVGETGTGDGQFSYPSQIAWMGGNRFAVTEWGNDRVQIVEIDAGAVEEAAAQTPVRGAERVDERTPDAGASPTTTTLPASSRRSRPRRRRPDAVSRFGAMPRALRRGSADRVRAGFHD